MKKISKDKWTDGEHIYEGNPKDGFKKVGDEKRAQEIVEAIKERDDNVIEASAFELKKPKKEVDTESQE